MTNRMTSSMLTSSRAAPACCAATSSGPPDSYKALRRHIGDETPDPLRQALPRLARGGELFAVSAEGIDLGDVNRFGEILAGWKVPVERGRADPGPSGDISQEHIGSLFGEEGAGRGDYRVEVPGRVNAVRTPHG
jgi:hypothetical protein